MTKRVIIQKYDETRAAEKNHRKRLIISAERARLSPEASAGHCFAVSGLSVKDYHVTGQIINNFILNIHH